METKKKTTLIGTLLCPLVVGSCALIHYRGQLMHTSSSICSMRRKTGLMMSHVDKMLTAYEAICKEAQNTDEARRWDVLYLRYIGEEKLSVNDVAERLHVDKRTVFRDSSRAMEDMAVLLFGIEAIGTWKHKR